MKMANGIVYLNRGILSQSSPPGVVAGLPANEKLTNGEKKFILKDVRNGATQSGGIVMRHEGHEHTHDHPHCHGDCSGCSQDPKAEVLALMRYMVNHNAQHAHELAELAKKLNTMGDSVAYEQVMQAVSYFEKGNLRLSTVLSALDTQ